MTTGTDARVQRVLTEVNPAEVENNLFSLGLYPVTLDDEFVKSIERDGVLQPVGLYRDADGKLKLIFGHKRVAAARKLGKQSIPAYIYEGLSELDIKRLVIDSNKYRVKDEELILREFEARLAIEQQESQERELSGKAIAAGGKRGEAVVLAATAAGISPSTGRLGSELLGAIDLADAQGDTGRATELRGTLNKKGVRPAHRAAFPQGTGGNGKPTNGRKSNPDRAGVPPRVKKALDARGAFDSALAIHREYLSAIRKLAKAPGGELLAKHLQEAEDHLANARRILAFGKPMFVCVYCNASGEPCEGCDKRGWVSQDTYDQAPSELKAKKK
jgi:ParB-like chromosome segregation protein Spo0J